MVAKTNPNEIRTAPVPTGGLNTRDALSAMPPTDCPVLVNWIPDINGMRSRGGYFEWAINFPSSLPIRSIVSFFSATDTFPGGTFVETPSVLPGKVFAATDAGIYDITTTTNAPALSVALSGNSMAGWLSSSMFTNSAGSWLLVCSEADGYKYYNGAAWTTVTLGAGAGQISGIDPTTLVHVTIWKKRAWFVERNSTRAWYLSSEAITGAASSFNFGPLFKKGGHLAFLANWTMDAGEGIDDFLVAVSSNGDVVIYKGTDPSSVDTFGLVGQWYVGQIPVGRRCHTQLGGDLVLLSTEGIFPVSQITRGGTALLSASGEYSSKIRPSIGADLRQTFTSRGWQMAVHPSERLLVVTVPDNDDFSNRQYAMSTTLMAWTMFDGVPTYCIGVTAGYMLAGTLTGKVCLVLNGDADAAPYGTIVGNPIRCLIQFPFNYFEAPALEKNFVLGRASFLASIEPASNLRVNVNFTYDEPQSPAVSTTTPGLTEWDGNVLSEYSLFDGGYWDGAVGDRTLFFSRWVTVSGLGFAAAATMASTHSVRTTLTAVDYVYFVGGPL